MGEPPGFAKLADAYRYKLMTANEAVKLTVTAENYDGIKPVTSIKKAPRKIVKSLLRTRESTFKEEAKKLVKLLCGSFRKPSEIQKHCWPALAAGKDIIGVAETGSGKTLAFAVPLLAKLCLRCDATSGVKMLVVAPTRELSIQIHSVIADAALLHSISTACVYGGTPRKEQINDLSRRKPSVIIGTPGRLVDLLADNVLDLSSVGSWVLDEADRMLDMGFEPELRQLAAAMSSADRHTVMFSATWPLSIQAMAKRYLKPDFCKVTIHKGELNMLKAASGVKQIVEVLDGRDKDKRIIELLRQYHSGSTRTILFVLYKKEAVRIEQLCRKNAYACVTLHGDMSQPARESAYKLFKSGEATLLIATDVAARGLDIPSVSTVLNYTFPLTIEDYVHRVGRTGRAGMTGLSHTLFTAAESKLAAELVAQLKAAGQQVPDTLLAFGGTTRRKEHSEYGAFYREPEPGAKPKHVKFDEDE